MEPLRIVDAVAAPLESANIDTDQVIPARFIQKPRANDFGAWLFLDARRAPCASCRTSRKRKAPKSAVRGFCR